jgi:hypothetical protein
MGFIKKILLDAYKEGWTPMKSKKHLKLKHPSGAVVAISRTPSDHRAALNIRGDLRRALRRRSK